MKFKITRAPTFTKGIIAAAVFAIIYLASTSNLPSCSDTYAVLTSGSGECIERQSFLHTASGWLAIICLIAAVVLLIIKHKDRILAWQASLQQQARPGNPASGPAPAPGQGSNFCAKCGTRIITGDRFCQGCGVPMGTP